MASTNKLIQTYDRQVTSKMSRLYYDSSDYCNLGYWTPETKTQSEACARLTTTLIDYIPNKQGKILDVACGLGATTRELTSYYSPSNITAIDVSDFQLRRAEQNAPGCEFRRMDATSLDFPDASFDALLCVEAAFHFRSRDAFLKEAARVLKPGGFLVLSDMIFNRLAHISKAVPRENYIRNMKAYHANLVRCGFAEDSKVIDATKECWTSFAKYQAGWYGNMRKARMITPAEAGNAAFWMRLWRFGMRRSLQNYILVAAHKAG